MTAVWRSKWNEKRKRNDYERWNWQGSDVCEQKCLPGLWEFFWLFICSTQTSLQAQFDTCSAWLPRNWKRQKTQKAWDWIHTIFQNAITRLLTVCVARTERLCGIMHKLGNVQLGPKFLPTPAGEQKLSLLQRREKRQREEEEKTQNRLERSLRSSLTALQLYTFAVGEHRMHHNRVVVCVCVCVCGQDKHRNTDTNTGVY